MTNKDGTDCTSSEVAAVAVAGVAPGTAATCTDNAGDITSTTTAAATAEDTVNSSASSTDPTTKVPTASNTNDPHIALPTQTIETIGFKEATATTQMNTSNRTAGGKKIGKPISSQSQSQPQIHAQLQLSQQPSMMNPDVVPILPSPVPQQPQQQQQQQIAPGSIALAPQHIAVPVVAIAPNLTTTNSIQQMQPMPISIMHHHPQQQQQQQLPTVMAAGTVSAVAHNVQGCTNLPAFAPLTTTTIPDATSSMIHMNTAIAKNIPNAPVVTRGTGGGHLLQFPWKLHEMLRLAEEQNMADIISWLPGGSGFKVYDKERFRSIIMPGYFASQKYKTFQRSLNLWGFESVSKGPERGACYHQYFVKGHPELCHSMTRVKIKGKGNARVAAVALAAARDAATKAATAVSAAQCAANQLQGAVASFMVPGRIQVLPHPGQLLHPAVAVNGQHIHQQHQFGVFPNNYNAAMQNYALQQLQALNPTMNAMITSQLMAAAAPTNANPENTNISNRQTAPGPLALTPIAPAGIVHQAKTPNQGLLPIAPQLNFNVQGQDYAPVKQQQTTEGTSPLPVLPRPQMEMTVKDTTGTTTEPTYNSTTPLTPILILQPAPPTMIDPVTASNVASDPNAGAKVATINATVPIVRTQIQTGPINEVSI